MDYSDHLPDPPVAVRTAGESAGGPHASSPGTRQGDWLVLAVLAGQGEYRCAAGHFPLRHGTVGLVDPADPGLLLSDAERPYRYRYCRFAGDYAAAWAAALRRRLGAPMRAHPAAADLGEVLGRMGRWHAFELPRCLGRREALLIDALRLLAEQEAETPPRPPVSAAQIVVWLEERLDQPSDLRRMAEAFGMSPSGLCRAVRRLCGSTPQRLHERMKMDWAPRLLAQRDLAVTEVARRLGYEDPLYFSRVFKRHHGCAPRAWRDTP